DTLTLASGNLATPTVVSIRRYGRTTLTHAGYATPMGAGTFGFNYSLAGYSLDERVGQNLTVPAGSVTGYSSFLKAQTDFFTFSYGQASDRMSWGLGLVIANQYLRLSERYGVTAGGVQVGTVDATATGTSNGIGAVGGVQMPMGDDAMLGVSVRTPISLQGNSDTTDLYSVIPGTASLGYVARTNPESRTGDFLTYSAQLDWFFGGSGVGRFERDSTLAGGFGLEYSLNRADARWPIRLGWRFNPAQGPTFESRDGYSLGLGWRPDGGALGIDLSLFRSTRGGPYDAALGLTYQLGR
ncbi:MAG: hypothetical protein MH204_02095, partial [Fimbriimonadaceae bacterium]|nr:hypothetical protein [Fimbriimonadaceae bacterium]